MTPNPAPPTIVSELRAPTHIVGIGASAGGLESLEQFFRNLPGDLGMAFVVVQHLSPDFKSMMFELLGRDTKLPIHVVEDGMEVQANTIYLLPPKKEMIIAGGQLHLAEKNLAKCLALPIDLFFESLARECGEAAVAIILSGSGSDGSRGVCEIARRGGLVISESLESAKFDGMPSSAQATGIVDLILKPEEMGAALEQYRNTPFIERSARGPRDAKPGSKLKGMELIFECFQKQFDFDFSAYRETTVRRRILRRMNMVGAENIDHYAEMVAENPTELQALYCDLLIGVTEFFRDPEVFRLLTGQVLRDMVSDPARSGGIRAWVAGCATGEEAYSLAIAFHEAMRATNVTAPLKIFATDAHKGSIDQASRGFFRSEAIDQLDAEIRQRYFISRSGGYQIVPEIRKAIVFAPHNLLRDAPFTELDFISCRNLLIYLQPAAQMRAISMFHYGLRVNGVLLLGGSESLGELGTEFDVLHERARLFVKKRNVRLVSNLRPPLAASLGIPMATGVAPLRPAVVRSNYSPSAPYDELLSRFMPPSLLVDHNRAVVDTFGGAEKLLRFPARQPSVDVLELVHREIRTTLSGALGRAMKEHSVVRFGDVQVAQDQGVAAFNLTVTPLGPPQATDKHYLIAFEPTKFIPSTEAPAEPAPGELDASRAQIVQLETDLRSSRENLQATIEELETSNEELQATNEELIASNEELQSTNEELHSLNEELHTVNAEHQRKIEELAEVNRDMHHLLENTDVATVFLDADLRIRRFTSRVRDIFELIDQDVGRPILNFSSKLRFTSLGEHLRGVLTTGKVFECETTASDGRCYLMRLLPYRVRDEVQGVVMLWVDVSSMEALRGRLRWLSAIVDSTDDAIIGQNLEGIITSWNSGAERLYGYTAAEAIGRPVSILIPPKLQHEIDLYRAKLENGERLHAVDTVRLHRSGRELQVSLTVSPVFGADGQMIGISKIARDISQRVEMERTIRKEIRQREQFLAMLSHELRNPLNATSSASSLLADPRSSDETRAVAAEAIQRQVAIMSHLLIDLLDVARIAENRIVLKRKLLDQRDLVNMIRETAEPELQRHGCTLEVECPDEPLWVDADPTRLIQVYVNLVHNAAKYSARDKVIRLRMERQAGQVVTTVTDEGIGIPADKLEQIFEPFTQLAESRDHSEGGLGVGLTLVKALVERHGGRVVAESAGIGHGSTFAVWLPVVERLDIGDKHAHSNGAVPAAPLRIAIIEDLSDNLEMLRRLLEIDGHKVLTARTGEAGLALILEHRPDVAIVDIGLPGLNGYQVAQGVRTQVDSQQTRLVALTGNGQQGDIDAALAAGFDVHLVKPVDLGRLHEALAKR